MNAAEVMSALSAHDASVAIEGSSMWLLFPEGKPPPAELIKAARCQREALRTILEHQRVAASSHYGSALAALRSGCPKLIDANRWQQAIADADTFLATWEEQAHALGWTDWELFGLLPVPANPAPRFQRLSRYDATGLIWLLHGRPAIAITADHAAIQGHTSIAIYRKHNKPALGPVGDSLRFGFRRMSKPTPLSQPLVVAERWKNRCGESALILNAFERRKIIDLRTWFTQDGKLKPGICRRSETSAAVGNSHLDGGASLSLD